MFKYLRDVASGRVAHWNKTAGEVINQLHKRLPAQEHATFIDGPGFSGPNPEAISSSSIDVHAKFVGELALSGAHEILAQLFGVSSNSTQGLTQKLELDIKLLTKPSAEAAYNTILRHMCGHLIAVEDLESERDTVGPAIAQLLDRLFRGDSQSIPEPQPHDLIWPELIQVLGQGRDGDLQRTSIGLGIVEPTVGRFCQVAEDRAASMGFLYEER